MDLNWALFSAYSPDLRLFNRLEKGYEISCKDNLFRNLWFMCNVASGVTKRTGQALYEIVPVTFSFRLNESCFSEDLQNFAKFFLGVESGKGAAHVAPADSFFDKYSKEHPIYFDFELRTYQRPSPFSQQRNKFMNPRADLIRPERYPSLFAGKNVWMLKPSDLSRGRGLELFSNLEELKKFLHMYTRDGYAAQDYAQLNYSDDSKHSPWVDFEPADQRSSNSSARGRSVEAKPKKTAPRSSMSTFQSFVIQKYMERPLLYKGYKFDIRVYALLTHERELWVFHEAYVRLASYQFSLENMNYYVHLTNNAVQCNSKNYGSLLKGNILGLTEFELHVAELEKEREKTVDGYKSGFELDGQYFIGKIRDSIKDCFDATSELLNPNNRKGLFELYGFDFMIDEGYKVWLLECNSVPSLGESNPFLTGLLCRMVGKPVLTQMTCSS